MQNKPKIALVRGDSLKEQESQVWEGMLDQFSVTAFCGKKNVFPLKPITLPYIQLPSSADNFILKNAFKYCAGQYQRMFGLEKKLATFDIAHGVEAYNYYTLQCVRAKKLNPKLKVVANFVDNTFGRFEYNYWPGFRVPPQYWRNKLNATIAECVRGVDMFLAFTEYSKELLLDLGAQAHKVIVAYPDVLIDKPDDSFYNTLHLGETEFFLVVCRMIWEKGIYDILYAWRMYLRETKNAHKKLVIAGGGAEVKNVKRLIRELGLSDTVIFLGAVSNTQVRQLYKHARAFILGSAATRTWQEQCPYVLMEALHENCPIICSDSGGNPEMVGTAGIVVPASNPVGYKKAMLAMDDDTVRRSLKENGLRERERFNLVAYRKKMAEIYFSLLM